MFFLYMIHSADNPHRYAKNWIFDLYGILHPFFCNALNRRVTTKNDPHRWFTDVNAVTGKSPDTITKRMRDGRVDQVDLSVVFFFARPTFKDTDCAIIVNV